MTNGPSDTTSFTPSSVLHLKSRMVISLVPLVQVELEKSVILVYNALNKYSVLIKAIKQ